MRNLINYITLLCLILLAGCEGFISRTIVIDDLGGLHIDSGDKIINGIPAVFVEKGTFMMGCRAGEDDCYFDETLHEVTLTKSYWISKYPITNYQLLGSAVLSSEKKHPVIDITWDEAVDFAKSKGGLLPTEAQWEFAARGGNKSKNSGGIYSGSSNLDAVGWYNGNSNGAAQTVGQKLPNQLGIYDMSGNVYEWCSDWYGFYTEKAVTDPVGPNISWGRVSRGGAWDRPARDARIADRAYSDPKMRAGNLGFRIVWAAD